MSVTKVKTRWDSGNLIFHEYSSKASTHDLLKIETGIITVGNASNDVDFKIFMGASDKYAEFNCGTSTITLAKVDVALSGDLTVTVEDISVAFQKYIYFDGQDSTEYIRSDTADELTVNAAVAILLSINGTDEVKLATDVFSPGVTDNCALGSTSLYWSDLFLADGGKINFNNDVIITHSTNALTLASTWTADAVGRPWGVNLTLSVVGGNYVNAIKGYVDCTTNDGGTIGLLSAVNCEIAMPDQCRGAYYPLEIEWVGKTSTAFGDPGTGSQSGFMTINCSGFRDYMDSAGVFFTLNGLTAETDGMLSANSQTLRVDIEQGTTRYLVMSQIQNGIGLGAATDNTIEYTEGAPVFRLYAECDNTTSTNAEPFYVYSKVDGVGGYGGRSRFHTYSNVASGTNVMALKAHMEYGASGSTSGFSTAFCPELVMPNASVNGSYYVIECEYVAGGSTTLQGSIGSSDSGFIFMQSSGDIDGDFDDNGFLFRIQGLNDNTTHLLYGNTLRMAVGTTTWYMPLSSAERSYTSAYPVSLGLAAGSVLSFTGAATNLIDFNIATPTCALHFVDEFTGMIIETGTYASAVDNACKLSSTNYRPASFLYDDGGDTLGAANYRGILSRIYMGASQAGHICVRSIRGQLKFKAGTVINVTQNQMGAMNGVDGFIETAGALEFGSKTRVAAIHGTVGHATGVLTLGHVLAGLMAELNINAGSISGGITAGLYIDQVHADHGLTCPWPYGIYIADSGTTIGMSIGDCATGIDMSGAYTTAGISIATTMAAHDDYAIYIATSCADTSDTVIPLYIDSVTTAVCKARAAEFRLTPTAQLGQWANVVKTLVDLTGASGATGLLASLCAEVLLPDEAMTGTMTVLELELVSQSGFVSSGGVGSNCVSFISANLSGTDKGEIDDHGYFLNIQGLADDTTHMLYDNTLKCAIGTTIWYLPFSSAEASFTTAYPITVTNTLTVGATGGGNGADARFYGTTNGVSMLWDEDENGLYFAGAPGASNPMLAVGTSGAPIAYTTANDTNVAAQIYSNYTGDTGFFRGLYSQATYTPASGTAAASVYAMRGRIVYAGTSFNSNENMTGVHGHYIGTGAVDHAFAVVAGVRGEVGGSTTYTTVRWVAGTTGELKMSSGVTTGVCSAFVAYATENAAAKSMFYAKGYFTNGIDMSGWDGAQGSAFVFASGHGTDTAAHAGAEDGHILVTVGGDTRKIRLYD